MFGTTELERVVSTMNRDVSIVTSKKKHKVFVSFFRVENEPGLVL